MANLSYSVEVDWDNDGSFNGAADVGEDVTSRVLRQEWRRGKDRPHYLAGQPQPGTARIVLNNDSGDYSPRNSASPLAGNLVAGRRVRIRSDNGGATTTRWQGFLQNIVPQAGVGRVGTVTLTCTGPLGFIAGREVEVAMQTGITTDQAVAGLLDAAGWPKDYADEVAADSPVGYWRLGEASGNAIDASGNGNDGAVTGVTQNQTGLLGDDTDKSALWDGLPGDIDFGSPSEVDDIFATGGTVEGWINADTDGQNDEGRIFDKTTWYLAVVSESGGTMKLRFGHTWSGTDGQWTTTNAVVTANQTHHVAVAYNGAATTNAPIIYVDGIAVAVTEDTTPTGTIHADAANNLLIGNLAADTRTFDGHLDEMALYSNILTAARVKAHWIAGVQQWRDLDTGKTTMARWWVDRMDVLQALRIVEETEFGLIYETKEGKIAFRNRENRLANRTSQATFSDAPAAALAYQGCREADPVGSVFNIFETEVQLFTVGGAASLWTYPETAVPYLAPGESRIFWGRYPVNDSPNEDVGVDAWTTPDETEPDYQANSLEAGGGTDLSASMTVTVEKFGESMKISITNAHATLPAYLVNSGGTIVLQARGTPVSGSDPIPIREEDATSQIAHGQRTWQGRDLFVPNTAEALAWSQVGVDLYKDPTPEIGITVAGNRSPATLDEVQDRDLNERMTVKADGNAGLGFDQDWFIEGEHHVVNEKFEHRVTWDLSDTTPFDLYWVIGTSELGTESKLSY